MKKEIIGGLGENKIIEDIGDNGNADISQRDETSNSEIEQKPKPTKGKAQVSRQSGMKRVLSDKQKETLAKGRESRDVKRKERITEKQRQEEEQKREKEGEKKCSRVKNQVDLFLLKLISVVVGHNP